MNTRLSPKAQKVQTALNDLGVTLEVNELPASTRTSQEAADAIGCKVAQIAKSLVFKTVQTQKPVLIIASGTNRVDEKLVAQATGEDIKMPDADFVRNATGFAIGGIPPVGHKQQIDTYIDEDLLKYDTIWAAAGTPHAVFKLTPQTLQDLTKGKLIEVAN